MKYDNQLRYAVSIVQQYDGRFPMSAWLKDFFRENKQMGSRDRKTVAHLVYSYYRLGHCKFPTIEERIRSSMAICSNTPPELLEYFKPAIPDTISSSCIFPWIDSLSEDMDKEAFAVSFLKQPDLFLRLRPGKENTVLEKLDAAGLAYQKIEDRAISLPNATRADTILEINKEAVIQDLSSQRTGKFMQALKAVSAWDCCAASGGKSIMAFDLIPDIQLTVSDIRPSIIHNLHERFREAGIKTYDSFTANLTDPDYDLPGNKYDLIIADVPCSGSGTWARTPEQLLFFQQDKIHYYSELQRNILQKVIPALKPGGILLYITCSVFKQENEEAVEFVIDNSILKCTAMEIIKGYNEKADTMFAATFTY
ncbi:MAG: Fmu (Sun) domain-containing protein [Chitinophagaceae bacterium]|nr:Fmu (Sun) domain-containing protein [Chitinophagaceae bacterium]